MTEQMTISKTSVISDSPSNPPSLNPSQLRYDIDAGYLHTSVNRD